MCRQVADFASTLDAYDVHLYGAVENHDHVSADDTGDANGSTDLEVGVRLHQFGGFGADAAIIQIQIGLLLGSIVLGDGQVGIGTNTEDGAVIERDARTR